MRMRPGGIPRMTWWIWIVPVSFCKSSRAYGYATIFEYLFTKRADLALVCFQGKVRNVLCRIIADG